jgi:hypothetical protein
MILQRAHAHYRIVLETSGANNLRIVELHWRDFAVFVSLSSRTNTLPEGLRLCDASGAVAGSREQDPILFNEDKR